MMTIEVSEKTYEILQEVAKYMSETSKLKDGSPIYETPRDAINGLLGSMCVHDTRIDEIVTSKY